MMEELVVLVTVPSQEVGVQLADMLVGERLAACVNIVGPIESIYRWEGKLCRDQEHLLIIKTARARYDELEARVRAAHPYDVPEVIALPIVEGSEHYLQWIRAETK